MGMFTVYCIISGCTPAIARNIDEVDDQIVPSDMCIGPYGPVVNSAMKSLADQHELSSQNNLCIIAPTGPSGQWEEYPSNFHDSDPDLELDLRVVTRCVMGESWDVGFVEGPPPNEQELEYLVSSSSAVMVQTYALDIMALATEGRMTPLRLWRLAMQQGFEDACPDGLEGVNYGAITGSSWEQFPREFPGFPKRRIRKLEAIGDVEVVKQRLTHEGRFWVWMAPDRFPVSPTDLDLVLTLPKIKPSTSLSAVENLPAEVLISVVSSLPLSSLVALASASRSLCTAILGNDYLARVWIYDNAPWWIPVPTQTPGKADQTESPTVFLASGWSADFQLSIGFPTGLDWAYITRCMRSGSMLNRRRIWNTVLDIERTADLAGV